MGDAGLHDLVDRMLEDSINFSSPMFLGFPDAGNAVAGLVGSVVEALGQQNLLNASFCARAATFVEMATVQWLRELIGYQVTARVDGVATLGGVATTGGTSSNLLGLLMARKRAYPDAFRDGVPQRSRPIVAPRAITHYSIAGAVGLLGLGTASIVQVPTREFRYDLAALDRTLSELVARGQPPMCVVVNAGDSRTLTIDPVAAVIAMVRERTPDTWVHVDACHGFQLLFSERLRGRLAGIDQADSIAIDPHKVLGIPYTLSYFLFRDPCEAEDFWSTSPLITGEPNSLGRLTPGIGSKAWFSLKLYLLLRHLGRARIGESIERRLALAAEFRARVESDPRLVCMTPVSDVNSVPFVYRGSVSGRGPAEISRINRAIYQRLLHDGELYLHGFDLADDADRVGFGRDEKYFVLRYMAGNPSLTTADLDRAMEVLRSAARQVEELAA